MSFQSTEEIREETQLVEIIAKSKNPFENHMIQCLKAPEWEFRKWLRKVLTRAGFEIFEDGYESDRCKRDPRYKSVHNMVAIRGNNPAVCLAAHTDVCRDHDSMGRWGSQGENNFWMRGRHMSDEEKEKLNDPVFVDPVIKVFFDQNGVQRRVVQDRLCQTQTGGDDRLGCAINTWIALNTGYDMGLYFPTDEEIGLRSARACEMPQLKGFELVAQVDRGNNDNGPELVVKIGGEHLCTYDTAATLLDIAFKMGKPRQPVTGMSTDVVALHSKGLINDAVNMTCGYHASHSSSPEEYIDIDEAVDTLHYVQEIVKYYYLKSAM